MTLHPAEFARRGYRLLQRLSKDFYKNKEYLPRLRQLTNEYNKQILELYNSRVEWKEQDYFIKNIEAFVIGAISSIIIVLVLLFVSQKFELLHYASLSITVSFYGGTAFIGGIIAFFLFGPKPLHGEEKESVTISSLYKSPNELIYKYEALKKDYQMKDLEAGETIGNLPSELSEGGSKSFGDEDDSNSTRETSTRKAGAKKKRDWGLSEDERETRKNILSMRFLVKVAKMKEGVVEEKIEIIQKPFIVVIEPDPEIAENLSNVLESHYAWLTFSTIKDMNQHKLERQPNMIICEAAVDNLEYLESVKKLTEQFDPDKTSIVIYTKDATAQSLTIAKELGVVDYWIKQFTNNNKLYSKRSLIEHSILCNYGVK